ncbi:WD40-repeat-containing domain protein [Suillus subalutaceus]|uniref:WD40-repeat-containing domain protein n=1 Tax=Suillus subalutaceus TaxID=48586 RepID=UPI001B85BA2B|nr:WD40-repeat-containing domain protein [Suillus subalutaceus]KAG1853186.1 WD40-repeat-containing domain protein [Suillus subalutaceus]
MGYPAPVKYKNSATMPYRKIKVKDRFSHILYLPGGQRIIISSRDGSFLVWDLERGTQFGEEWEDKERSVETIVLSPDGKTVATGSEDGAVKLWNVDTGKVIKTLTGNTSWVKSVWVIHGECGMLRVEKISLDQSRQARAASGGDRYIADAGVIKLQAPLRCVPQGSPKDISSTRAGLVLKWVNMEDLCVYSRQHKPGPLRLHYPRSASSNFSLDAERGIYVLVCQYKLALTGRRFASQNAQPLAYRVPQDISSTRAGLVLKWVNLEDLCVYSLRHKPGPVKLRYPRSASSSIAPDAERG